jgi:hypothetical protein
MDITLLLIAVTAYDGRDEPLTLVHVRAGSTHPRRTSEPRGHRCGPARPSRRARAEGPLGEVRWKLSARDLLADICVLVLSLGSVGLGGRPLNIVEVTKALLTGYLMASSFLASLKRRTPRGRGDAPLSVERALVFGAGNLLVARTAPRILRWHDRRARSPNGVRRVGLPDKKPWRQSLCCETEYVADRAADGELLRGLV